MHLIFYNQNNKDMCCKISTLPQFRPLTVKGGLTECSPNVTRASVYTYVCVCERDEEGIFIRTSKNNMKPARMWEIVNFLSTEPPAAIFLCTVFVCQWEGTFWKLRPGHFCLCCFVGLCGCLPLHSCVSPELSASR